MWLTENTGLVSFDIAIIAVSAILYMLGGTAMSFGGQKWIRRFLASFLLAVAVNVTALVIGKWTWQYTLTWPALIFGFSLGYGADRFFTKIVRRSVYALGVISASVFCLWAINWSIMGIGILICQVVLGGISVFLGVKNPYSNPPVEQAIICLLLTMFIPFWPFVV